MYSNTGYYNDERVEEMHSDTDFFVHCSGHYRLVEREHFVTERKGGTASYQLLYIADGNARFQIRGVLEKVEKGYCVLYRPFEMQYYEYRLLDHADVYWVHFSCGNQHKFFTQTEIGQRAVFKVGVHADYTRLFERMILELQMKKEYFAESNILRLQELLWMMARNQERDTKSDVYTYYPQVEAAIRRFHQHPEADFTIKEYAKENNLNYSRFIDSFTRITGLAPRQYIINIRMSKAKDLLGNEAFSVGDVAKLVGYENALYFSRIFHKQVGMSPSEYRAAIFHKFPLSPQKGRRKISPDVCRQ